jgi:uncharacterized protein YdhG (YjbR/CyaY superfamily)
MPDGAVIYFAGWKQHYSLYPIGARIVETLGEELAAYPRSKGTIRFPLSRPVPVRLIARLARLRAAEVEQLAKAKKKTSPKKRPK